MSNIDFIPENKLEELLIELHKDLRQEKSFNEELLKSDLYVFAESEKVELDENGYSRRESTIWIKDILYKDKMAVLVFTSLSCVSNFIYQTEFMKENESYFASTGSVLLRSILESPKKIDLIIINAKTPYELHTTPQKIAHVLKK